MGIPGFNIWFSEKYSKTYVPLGNVRVDHLYIDLNSVLHTVMRRAKDHDHFHKMLHKRLGQILEITQPRKSVMIAVDGPAPLAKLLTQRDRRKKNGRSVDEGETLTSVAITPGTTFMLDLTHSLTYYCCTKMSSKRFRHLVFELSDGTVKGEGEVKVLGRLARHWYPEDPDDTHVILGDDADLILMALTSYKENLYVANSGLNDGKLNGRTPCFSVNLLHQQWASNLVARVVAAGQVPLSSALLHAKLDLTLIAILTRGNDYLPGLRGAALEGPGGTGLWPAYQRVAASSQHLDPIQQPPVAPPHGNRKPSHLGRMGSITTIDPATGTPQLEAAALAALLAVAASGGGVGAGADEWRGSKAAADAEQYLRGCVWLLQMYLTGQCPDYRFYYDGVAPTAAALRAACEAAVASGRPYLTLDSFGPSDPRADQPLLPVACALALLPANCRHLAAPCVRHLMEAPAAAAGAISGGDDDVGATESGGSGSEEGRGGSAAERAAALDAELYYDLYGECGECRRMTAAVPELQRWVTTTRSARTLIVNRLEAVRQGTAPVGEASEQQLEQELETAEAQYQSAKSSLQSMERARQRHTATAHPYRRFPIEALEAAAEAALSARAVAPEEHPATSFGRPLVLRAFDRRDDAASFIRTHLLPTTPARTAPNGQPYQLNQTRTAFTASGPAGRYPQPTHYNAIYQPPPPPFVINNENYFAAIVRQEILYDEYGSGQALELRLPPPAPDGAVRYLSQVQHQVLRRQQQAVQPSEAASPLVKLPLKTTAAAASVTVTAPPPSSSIQSSPVSETSKRPREEESSGTAGTASAVSGGGGGTYGPPPAAPSPSRGGKGKRERPARSAGKSKHGAGEGASGAAGGGGRPVSDGATGVVDVAAAGGAVTAAAMAGTAAPVVTLPGAPLPPMPSLRLLANACAKHTTAASAASQPELMPYDAALQSKVPPPYRPPLYVHLPSQYEQQRQQPQDTYQHQTRPAVPMPQAADGMYDSYTGKPSYGSWPAGWVQQAAVPRQLHPSQQTIPPPWGPQVPAPPLPPFPSAPLYGASTAAGHARPMMPAPCRPVSPVAAAALAPGSRGRPAGASKNRGPRWT